LWAPSCKACFAVSPIVRELATEYRGKVDFVRVNVDKNPDVASDYGIMSLPALLVFDGGNLVEQIVGLRPKEQLKRLVNSSVPAGLGV
ncbi:MAG: thioredoxin family protein, partial [Dehalococcoidia bacterium]